MSRSKLVIGIETSCDETAIAILRPPRELLANIISSSLEKHKPFGGVVPEIACRHHLENIDIIFKEALRKAHARVEDIGLVAVTYAPGLIGALLVGVSFAKALSLSLRVPIVGVNHLESHLEANRLNHADFKAPYLGLIVSGGHTTLVRVVKEGKYRIVGQTVDDAIGEAFDKVAKLLGLDYPGGPVIDKLAREGDPSKITFGCATLPGTFNFSFSGIKTAVMNYKGTVLKRDRSSIGRCVPKKELSLMKSGDCHQISKQELRDICASFQKTVIEIIVNKTIRAAEKYNLKRISVGGGVSANSLLRKRLEEEAKKAGMKAYFPEMSLTLDNGAMVAMAGYLKSKRGEISDLKLSAKPSVGW